MKHQILGTLFLATAIVACGGSDSGNNGGSDGGITFVDASSPVDAAVAACNPLANTGCQPGEKCTYVIDTPQGADDPLGSTRCAPDGTKQAAGS